MKKIFFTITTITILLTQSLLAQRMGMMRRERLRRMEILEKAKLIELLDMDENTAIKFFAVRNKNMQLQKKLTLRKEELTDSLKSALKKGEKRLYFPLINKIITIDKKIAARRMSYFNKLRKILSEEQIAKLLVFEAKFKNEIKRMLFMRRR